MKIVLVTPYYHQPRGNTITVQRISEGLNHLGVVTEIISSTEEQAKFKLPQGDIIHGFNAYHFYRYILRQGPIHTPYLLTLTGTDLNHDLFNPERRDGVIQVLRGARAVHVFNKQARTTLLQEVPFLQKQTFIISQGTVNFRALDYKVKEKEAETFVFLLPAGIRQVKNISQAINMLNSLYNQESSVRLWIAGPIIEHAEARNVEELVQKNRNWVTYLGQIPHREMGALYKCADVVLNTSLSEGQSSAVLEAMNQGIPVLVSDIPGNQDIVTHGNVGFLYDNEREFEHFSRQLIKDSMLRLQMGKLGKEYVKKYHSSEQEVKDLLLVYGQVLENS
ncbi:MAG: glycosyltransferase [Carboxydocellales bacterium]